MLGRRRKRLQDISLLIDLAAGLLLLCGVFFFLRDHRGFWEQLLKSLTGYPFKVQTVDHLLEQGWILLVVPLALVGAQKFTRFYTSDLHASLGRLAWMSLRGVAAGTAAVALIYYFLGIADVNRSLTFLFSAAFLLYHPHKEWLLRRYWLRRKAERVDALLVASCRDVPRRLEALRAPASTVSVRGIFVTSGDVAQLPQEIQRLVVKEADGVERALAQGGFDMVLLGETGDPEISQKVLASCEEQGVDVVYFSPFPIPRVATCVNDDFAGEPVLLFRTASRYESRLIVKRLFDTSVAIASLLVLLPVFIVIALAIHLSSAGPVFFVQDRTGWRGRTFRMIKFRTMAVDAEEMRERLAAENAMSGPVFKVTRDPRVTPIGRFLRRYSLDELPQLINVLKGEMSLVGPRPLPVYESRQMPAFRDYRRYSVLPGMTGLWQVSGRSEIRQFSDWVDLDLSYIDQWSLFLDIKILLKTLPAVVRGEGAH